MSLMLTIIIVTFGQVISAILPGKIYDFVSLKNFSIFVMKNNSHEEQFPLYVIQIEIDQAHTYVIGEVVSHNRKDEGIV